MIYIAHRGNIDGPKPLLENQKDYIEKALTMGFHAEVDVWVKDGKIMLGHDEGLYAVNIDFLQNKKIICHAKNIEAVEFLHLQKDVHWFWHQNDDCTLTSCGWIWAYPHQIINQSILNQPEFNKQNNVDDYLKQFFMYKERYAFLGVCSDYVNLYIKHEKESIFCSTYL